MEGIKFLTGTTGLKNRETDIGELKKQITQIVKQRKDKDAIFLKKFCIASFISGAEFRRKSLHIIPTSLISIRRLLKEQRLEQKHPSEIREIKKRKLPQPPLPVNLGEFDTDASELLEKSRDGMDVVYYPLIQLGDKTLVSAEVNDIYKVTAPTLMPLDIKVITKLKKYNLKKLGKPGFVRKKLEKICKNNNIGYSNDYFDKIGYFINRDVFGWGKIEALMRDSKITSISCKGWNSVFIIYSGKDKKTNISFSKEELDAFVILLAKRCGIDVKKEPVIDKTLSDGIRIQATYGAGVIGSKFIITKPGFV